MLLKLVETTKKRIERLKLEKAFDIVEKEAYEIKDDNDKCFSKALTQKDLGIICEIKKASPSKGIISEDFPYIEIAKDYELGNASAISVLTEEKYFLGSNKIFSDVRNVVSLPMLRKDFIIDEYQIYESKILGVSAILLIVSILDKTTLKKYLDLCKELKLEALVETHDENEIDIAINSGAEIIGINNRNLNNFQVDFENTFRLRNFIPKDKICIAESGASSIEDIKSLKQVGADVIELGIAFSDPMAEGEVIMKAYNRALEEKAVTSKVMEILREVRKDIDIPLVFMTYANVVFGYKSGIEDFIKEAAQSGIDGLILPDVPFEEKKEFSDVCDKYNIDLISLIAPSSKNRIEMIAKEAKGFLYCVSSLGVTGVRENINTDIDSMIKNVRLVSDIPCAIGFGISTKEQAKTMASKSDGVIVGSYIVSLYEKYKSESPKYVGEYVRKMKEAINE